MFKYNHKHVKRHITLPFLITIPTGIITIIISFYLYIYLGLIYGGNHWYVDSQRSPDGKSMAEIFYKDPGDGFAGTSGHYGFKLQIIRNGKTIAFNTLNVNTYDFLRAPVIKLKWKSNDEIECLVYPSRFASEMNILNLKINN